MKEILYEIIERVEEEFSFQNLDKLSLSMDLASIEEDESFEMDWKGLLKADKFNFMHDLCGIQKHIDRTSFPGKLRDGFRPRFAN